VCVGRLLVPGRAARSFSRPPRSHRAAPVVARRLRRGARGVLRGDLRGDRRTVGGRRGARRGGRRGGLRGPIWPRARAAAWCPRALRATPSDQRGRPQGSVVGAGFGFSRKRGVIGARLRSALSSGTRLNTPPVRVSAIPMPSTNTHSIVPVPSPSNAIVG